MRLRTYHPFRFLQKLLARRTVLLNKNESERYAEQNRRMFQTTSEELWVFLGITILMGINKLPKMRDYLSVEEGLCAIVIQKTVTINRFLEILQNIHFTNNLQQHHQRTVKIMIVHGNFDLYLITKYNISKTFCSKNDINLSMSICVNSKGKA